MRVKAEERIEPGGATIPGRLNLTTAAAILNAQAVIFHFNHAIHRFFQETFEIATGGPRLQTRNAREGYQGTAVTGRFASEDLEGRFKLGSWYPSGLNPSFKLSAIDHGVLDEE